MLCNTYDPANFTNGIAVRNRNRITFSALTEHEMNGYCPPTYSIKYVLQGTEHYQLSKKRFSVSNGNFLLVNRGQASDEFIRSKKKVSGFCIHLQQQMMREVYAQLTNTTGSILEDPFKQSSLPDFETLIYSDKENSLGKYLQHIVHHFDEDAGFISLDEQEVFYNLAYHMVVLQTAVPKCSEPLAVLRSSTKQELLRRLNIAREVMDAQAGESLDVTAIAKEAMLSGSHFFRSFKKVYGVSPYQYLLKRKIEPAAQLLTAKKMTATEVAFTCGYPDLASFSKAFKKVYGQSPKNFERAFK